MTSSRFAAALRFQLEKPHRSQRWIRALTGMSSSSLNRILSDEQDPTREHLRLLCKAFPDWAERSQLLLAWLQDCLYHASGRDADRVLIRELAEHEGENLHLLPELHGYLRAISHRLMIEQTMPEGDQLFTPQVEWLSRAVARLGALEADHKAAYPESEDKAKAAAES